jgi:hypothetical protein
MWIAFLAVRDPFIRRTMKAMADQAYKLDLLLARTPDAARTRLRETLEREPSEVEVDDLVHAANDLDEFEVQPHQNEFIKLMLDARRAFPGSNCRKPNKRSLTFMRTRDSIRAPMV